MPNSEMKEARRCSRRSFWRCFVLCIFFLAIPGCLKAQVTLSSAVSLALQHGTRIRSAKLDLQKAQAALSTAKDLFIPSVTIGGGLGWTYGITLTVPTIFTVNAQSLVYSNQQRFQIRAAREDLEAAKFALSEARLETEEDVVTTYISLEENQAAQMALAEQREAAAKLTSILRDRVNAGLDSQIDLKKAQRGKLQLDLQQLQSEDDRAGLVAHLADLTGLSEAELQSLAGVPAIPAAHMPAGPNGFASPGISAAEASSRGKLDRARGDAGYAWRPIVTFGAEYGRISPINNVSSFYNLQNNYNTANVGAQLMLPLFDRVRTAAAGISMAEAARSAVDLQNKRTEEVAGRTKLQRSIRVMAVKAQMAQLDYEIAQQELESTTILQRATSGSAPLTPKEEQNARLQERQKYLDLLDARLQLEKAKISLLRQTGELEDWLHDVMLSAGP